jgi:hypothetical protein
MRCQLSLLAALVVLSTIAPSASASALLYEFSGRSLQSVQVGGAYSVAIGASVVGSFMFDADRFLVPAAGTSENYGTGGAGSPRGAATGIDLELWFEILLPTGEQRTAAMAQAASSAFGITIDNGLPPNAGDAIAMSLSGLQLSGTPLISDVAAFGLRLFDSRGAALPDPGQPPDLTLRRFDGLSLMLDLPVGLGSNAEVLSVSFSLDTLRQSPAVGVPEPSPLALFVVVVTGLTALMLPPGTRHLRNRFFRSQGRPR